MTCVLGIHTCIMCITRYGETI